MNAHIEFDDCAVDLAAILDGPDPEPEDAKRSPIKAQAIREKVRRHRCYDLSQVQNAVDTIRPLPALGEMIHAVMDGTFDGWSLVPAIRLLSGAPIAELWIATLGFNLSNNANLCDMLDAGDVQAVTVVCSEYFKGADPDVYQEAERRLKERGQRLVARRNHAKLILALTGGQHYVVESSANLRSCHNVEQFTLCQSRKVFDFHRRWIQQLITT